MSSEETSKLERPKGGERCKILREICANIWVKVGDPPPQREPLDVALDCGEERGNEEILEEAVLADATFEGVACPSVKRDGVEAVPQGKSMPGFRDA